MMFKGNLNKRFCIALGLLFSLLCSLQAQIGRNRLFYLGFESSGTKINIRQPNGQGDLILKYVVIEPQLAYFVHPRLAVGAKGSFDFGSTNIQGATIPNDYSVGAWARYYVFKGKEFPYCLFHRDQSVGFYPWIQSEVTNANFYFDKHQNAVSRNDLDYYYANIIGGIGIRLFKGFSIDSGYRLVKWLNSPVDKVFFGGYVGLNYTFSTKSITK